MGTQKLLLPLERVPMIDRVLTATRDFQTVVVASSEVAEYLNRSSNLSANTPADANGGATVIVNEQPERGMAHSFHLANEAIDRESALLVFLGDKPFVTGETIRAIVERAKETGPDVCFPERNGIGGHPVFFSTKARTKVDAFAGDSLQPLRDEPGLIRMPVPCDDAGAYSDLDTPSDMPGRGGSGATAE